MPVCSAFTPCKRIKCLRFRVSTVRFSIEANARTRSSEARLAGLIRLHHGQDIVSQAPKLGDNRQWELLIRREARHGSRCFVLTNLLVDLFSVCTDICPGIRQVLGAQSRIAVQQIRFARTKPPSLLQHPDGDPRLDNASLPATNPRPGIDAREGVTQITHKGAAPVPAGHSTCQAKNTARLTTTPTTPAVMPVSGAVNLRSPWVAATSGAPQGMNRNDGRKVKKVATPAPQRQVAGPTTFLGRGAD